MAKYRSQLPQCHDGMFITDGGIETTLIFRQGIDLPDFAAFVLFDSESGVRTLHDYYTGYARLALTYRMGLVLDSATWRANPDWASKLGYADAQLAAINRQAIEMLADIRNIYETPASPMVISGSIGPRGDGYIPSSEMSIEEAAQYHATQIETFAQTEADMVTAFTINYVEEAIGIARAARQLQMPAAISFTVETNGKLPTGQTLREAVECTDADTHAYPAYYMINCAHPTHFLPALAAPGKWLSRLYGVRANASSKSHAELNEATELDDGDLVTLAQQYQDVRRHMPNLHVVGGCCGTDQRHIEEICKAFAAST